MLVRNVNDVDDAVEWAMLERAHAGTIHQFRLEALGRRLRIEGPLAIASAHNGLSGNRVTLRLGDGSTLRLKLFYNARDLARELLAIWWVDGVGWAFDVRFAGGECQRLWAFHAAHDLGRLT